MKLKDEKDITLDGKEVGIYANIGSLDDLNSALYYGARELDCFEVSSNIWEERAIRERKSFPGIQEDGTDHG